MSDGTPDEPATPAPIRAGFCAIVGLPNVGKSTLLNKVLGQRIAAVSAKPQTTRNRILGVHHAEGLQIAFVDTPGIQLGPGALRRYMRDEALAAAGDADLALLVLDAAAPRDRGPDRLSEQDAAPLSEAIRTRPMVVALNKVDKIPKPDLLPLIERWDAWAKAGARDVEIVPIAALSGDGVEALIAAIARKLPLGPPLFPDDMLTDRPDRFLAGELIREQLYHQLGKELPYAAAVLVESYEERKKGDAMEVAIGAIVIVERESQKAIVVGKGGARIKQLGIAAREAVAEMLGCPVHLSLHVKVIPDWSSAERGLRQAGFEREGQS
jgi:GTP-binding protein Era